MLVAANVALSCRGQASLLLCNSTPPDFLHFQIWSLQTQLMLTQVTSLEAINHISHSCLWSHKILYTTLLTYAVVLPKTFKQTLMYESGGAPL